jgi:alcohol dehydrogenase
MALGHEAAGVVEEVGPGVTDLVRGDHVVLIFIPSCGHCNPCAEGRPRFARRARPSNTAGTLLSGERRLFRGDGSPVNHRMGTSAFADYAVVSRYSLVKIDPELPLDEAALFGCAVLTGVGAVVNTGQVRAGSSVAVVGLGGVGLASILGAVASGARSVIAVDISEDKLKLAGELGATHLFNAADPDVVQKVKDATKGGVDYAVEMAGSTRALSSWRAASIARPSAAPP